MKFFIKQFVGAMATPLAIALVVAAVAGGCMLRGRRKTAISLLIAAATIGYAGALAPVGNALLAPLERRYPPLSDDLNLSGVAGIVVLGTSYVPRDGVPVTGALDEDGLARVVEGVRLSLHFRLVPLVLSGGAPEGSAPSAIGYARLARDLGIPEASLIVVSDPLDTREEARAVARLFGNAQFILVTSASHMPRAVRLMLRAGAHPIPAPTGQRSGAPAGDLWRMLIPSGGGVRRTERALHEYLGLGAMALGLD